MMFVCCDMWPAWPLELDRVMSLNCSEGEHNFLRAENLHCPSAMQARFIELLHDMHKLVKASTGLSGAIYTQMADVESEVNGILTYDRKVLIC